MKRAFTLAEVLLSLAIIGVVLAMTVPEFIAKTSKSQEEYETQSVQQFSNNNFRNSASENNVDLNQYKDCSVLIINDWQIICKK